MAATVKKQVLINARALIADPAHWTPGTLARTARDDQLLEALPIGVIVFPGSGVTGNLADKARAMGIPLFDCRKAGGA